jgi:hypothetical protein
MTFLEPRGLFLFAGALPLVLLYVLKIRRPRVRVGSTLLWRAAEADLLARHPFRRLRNETSLLLELLALAALALALARPVTRGEALRGDHVAFVVDTSASMGTRESDGTTRLAQGIATARRRIAGLGLGADAFVVEAAEGPRVVTEPSADGDALGRALESLKPRPVEGDLEGALALAADRLRSAGGAGRIVVVTDGALAHPPRRGPEGIPVEAITVGAATDNVAIVRASVQPDAEGRNEVVAFALVHNFGSRPRDVTVTATVLDAPGAVPAAAPRDVAARRLLIEPGAEAAVPLAFVPRREDRGRGLRWALTPGDALEADDVAFGRVPPSPRLPVVLGTNTAGSWVARGLGADDGIDLRVVSLEQLSRVNVEPTGVAGRNGARRRAA